MKITSVFLALLLVGLNLWPCDDSFAEDTCGSEIHYHTSDNQNSNEDSDHCSPFCQCYCCHVQVENTQEISFSSDRFFFSIKRAFTCNRTSQKFIASLFEPPQVS